MHARHGRSRKEGRVGRIVRFAHQRRPTENDARTQKRERKYGMHAYNAEKGVNVHTSGLEMPKSSQVKYKKKGLQLREMKAVAE